MPRSSAAHCSRTTDPADRRAIVRRRRRRAPAELRPERHRAAAALDRAADRRDPAHRRRPPPDDDATTTTSTSGRRSRPSRRSGSDDVDGDGTRRGDQPGDPDRRQLTGEVRRPTDACRSRSSRPPTGEIPLSSRRAASPAASRSAPTRRACPRRPPAGRTPSRLRRPTRSGRPAGPARTPPPRRRRRATCRPPSPPALVLAGVFVAAHAVAARRRRSPSSRSCSASPAFEYFGKVTEKGYRPAVAPGSGRLRRRAAGGLLGRRSAGSRSSSPSRFMAGALGLHRGPRRRGRVRCRTWRSRRSASSGSGCSARSPR